MQEWRHIIFRQFPKPIAGTLRKLSIPPGLAPTNNWYTSFSSPQFPAPANVTCKTRLCTLVFVQRTVISPVLSPVGRLTLKLNVFTKYLLLACCVRNLNSHQAIHQAKPTAADAYGRRPRRRLLLAKLKQKQSERAARQLQSISPWLCGGSWTSLAPGLQVVSELGRMLQEQKL